MEYHRCACCPRWLPRVEGAHDAGHPTGPTRSTSRFAISILEAAKVLGISRSYAYQMAATGELPTLRLGRRILVPVAALRELVGLDQLR